MTNARRSSDAYPTRGHCQSFTLGYLAFAIAAFLFYGAMYAVYPLDLGNGALIGPDSYMHIVRLREFLAAGDWQYNAIARSNAPYGDVSHWTKPFELVLLLVTAMLRPFMDMASSTYWAGIVVSPILHVVLAFMLAWAGSPLLGRARIWVVPVALLSFPIIQQALPGRADHHVFLMVVFAAAVGFALRAILSIQARPPALKAGLAQAAAIWASVEFAVLPVLAMCFAAAWWILARDPGLRRQIADRMVVFAAALTVATAVFLAVERPPDDLGAADLDRLSIVYLLFAALAGLAWLAIRGAAGRAWSGGPATRAATVIAAGVAAAAAMAAVYPAFFQGPYADVPPLVERFFLRHVSEVRSILALSPNSALAYYADAIASVVVLLWIVWRRRARADLPGWLFLLGFATVYTALALVQLRFVTAAATLSVLPGAYLIDAIRRFSAANLKPLAGAVVRIVATFIIVLGPGMIFAAMPDFSSSKPERALKYVCPVQEIAPFLNAMDGQHTIYSPNIYVGPPLLFHTRHSVIGTPYHRNVAGIEDTYRIMSDTGDREARRLIRKRGIDLILICRKKNLERFLPPETPQTSLYARLKRQSPPDWLTPVKLPAPLDESFALYAVTRRH